MCGELEIPWEVGDRFRKICGFVISARERTVVSHQPFERLPREVETIEADVAMFEPRHEDECLGVVIEAAELRHAAVERCFTGMTEWRMTEIVRQCERFGQVFIQAEHTRHGA